MKDMGVNVEDAVKFVVDQLDFVDPEDEDEVDLIRDVVKVLADAGLLRDHAGEP